MDIEKYKPEEVDAEPTNAPLTERELFASRLLEIGKFFVEHPEVELPAHSTFYIWADAQNLQPIAKAFGKAKKQADEFSFDLVKSFGSKLSVRAVFRRDDVCEKVKVGEKKVPAQTVPAVEAKPEEFIPEHTEEIYEWKCPSVLEPKEIKEGN